MRSIVVVVGYAAAGLAAIAAGAFAFAWFGSEARRNRVISVNVAPIAVATSPADIARGRYLYETRGCQQCHGANGAGRVVIDEGGLLVRAPNITPAVGTATSFFGPLDWVRLLRHGVKPDGRPALIMPSEEYARMTDREIGQLIGYVRSLPAVEGQTAEIQLPLTAQFLYAAGYMTDAAARIDHDAPAPAPIEPAVTAAYGDHVADICRNCHNAALSGGPIPLAPGTWPEAANLTPGEGGVMARYADEAAFAEMLRTGHRPDGTPIEVMPFGMLKKLDETDVAALHLFLTSLPPRKTGEL